jgi:hypothetical protein
MLFTLLLTPEEVAVEIAVYGYGCFGYINCFLASS